jgi:hypothetical protein
MLWELTNSKKTNTLQIKQKSFSRVPLIYWATVYVASFEFCNTSIYLDSQAPFFLSKYWITTGNTFTAMWWLASVETPQQEIVIFEKVH